MPARLPLGFTPTPLHSLPNISRLEGTVNFYMKRDDLTGLALGGNKSRKLEYFFREALDQGASAIVTYGTTNSNHCRMTAAAAASQGLACVLVLNGRRPPERMSGNLFLDRLFGAELVFIESEGLMKLPYDQRYPLIKAIRAAATERVLADLKRRGHDKVFIVPPGGHGPQGTLGYVDAVAEILEQIREQELPAMDFLVTGFGSTGTFAGLWLGARYHRAHFKVVGVAIASYNQVTLEHTAGLIRETSAVFGLGVDCRAAELNIVFDRYRAGYNVPDPKTREFIYMLARQEGILSDPCYTGKVFGAAVELAREARFPSGSNVLILHSGGLPGLFEKEHLDAMENELWQPQSYTVYTSEELL